MREGGIILNKKEIGYRVFAMMYKFFCLFPRKKNRVFLVMTHDAGAEGNVGVVRNYLHNQNKNWEFCPLRRKDTDFSGENKVSKVLRFFIRKAYELATASYVFLDNTFLPMAYMKFPESVKIVQLWHGTGTIKKFGQDVLTGTLKEENRLCNESVTHLIVNSEETKNLYSHIFEVEKEKVFVTGLPRTDLLFSEKGKERKIERFYQEYPELVGKKLLLYAPTFRDEQVVNPDIALDIEKLLENLPEDVCLGLRLHPFVSDGFVNNGKYADRIYNFSSYQNINTLLFVADSLITDYSSIVFEYCVLKKPMYFYAWDLEKFSDQGRGFYEDYETYVPGVVVKTTEELLEALQKEENQREYWEEVREKFEKKAYTYQDGKSTKRLMKLLHME